MPSGCRSSQRPGGVARSSEGPLALVPDPRWRLHYSRCWIVEYGSSRACARGWPIARREPKARSSIRVSRNKTLSVNGVRQRTVAQERHRLGAKSWLTLDVVLLTVARQAMCTCTEWFNGPCVARDNLLVLLVSQSAL